MAPVRILSLGLLLAGCSLETDDESATSQSTEETTDHSTTMDPDSTEDTGSACCTEYCNLKDPDPDAICSGQADGQVCAPIDLGSRPVPGLEHVGICDIAD